MIPEGKMPRPNVNRKRSVIVSKKRTSVSLEDSFWQSLQAIVRMENTTIEKYIERIQHQRDTPNLSSNLRIAVLEYFQKLVIAANAPRTAAGMMAPAMGANGSCGDRDRPADAGLAQGVRP